MWSLPFLAGAGGAVLLAERPAATSSTDNAYVKGDRVYVATELSGPIVEVAGAARTSASRAASFCSGSTTSPTAWRSPRSRPSIEIQRAEIRGLRAQWRTKREDIKAALSQQVYAQADYERQIDLAERKFAPAAQARGGAHVGSTSRASASPPAEEDLQRIEAQLAGDPKIKVDDHPKVKQMLAARDEALLNLRRTTIEAPLDGIVSKVLVPGSYAVTGVPSIAVVADTDLWIEANFKETELTRVRVGQPVDHHGRHLSRHAVHREGDLARPVDRRGVRRAAAAERHRQLGQGGAAHPGAHLRQLHARAIRRCASA